MFRDCAPTPNRQPSFVRRSVAALAIVAGGTALGACADQRPDWTIDSSAPATSASLPWRETTTTLPPATPIAGEINPRAAVEAMEQAEAFYRSEARNTALLRFVQGTFSRLVGPQAFHEPVAPELLRPVGRTRPGESGGAPDERVRFYMRGPLRDDTPDPTDRHWMLVTATGVSRTPDGRIDAEQSEITILRLHDPTLNACGTSGDCVIFINYDSTGTLDYSIQTRTSDQGLTETASYNVYREGPAALATADQTFRSRVDNLLSAYQR